MGAVRDRCPNGIGFGPVRVGTGNGSSALSDALRCEMADLFGKGQHTMADTIKPSVLGLTAKIVSAHIARNAVATDALPALIQSVFHSLATAGEPNALPEEQAPAVPIKKSVFPDFIVCLEDGKKLKMLKRHLKTSYNLTPEQYREKWRLPATYPMVAPSYASHRSTLAKSIGLGRKTGATRATVAEPKVTVAPARRARGSKG